MTTSLLLDPTTWDLVIDSAGNIATTIAPYARAQDVASAIRTFRGEVRFNTSIGVPYFDEILGKAPPKPLLKQRLTEAALSVDGVASAVTYLSESGRDVTGQVLVTDSNGTTLVATF